ncbi:cation diffusion facilitator family transporter [Streptococcus ferus]|uniref:cation diffusion facilitator family transporter n=1 Tax=Streptococcus ferus TaxID=1345 RepID=UPI0035A1A64C
MSSSRKMWVAFTLNFAFSLLEFVFGALFHSSAVFADAVHDLGDACAIGMSAFLEKVSTREEDSRYSLGYKRFSLLGAILTSLILISGSVFVLFENVPKLFAPERVNYDGMLLLGLAAISVNVLAARIVSHGKSQNEKILSLHFLEDILGWLAVIVVSIVLRFTSWYFLDPLLSLVIALYILSKALPKCWHHLAIFLDRVPSDVDLAELKEALLSLENVTQVTQLNIWTLDGLERLAMVHLCLKNLQDAQRTRRIVHELMKTYHIQTVTIEIDQDIQDHQRYCQNRP